MRDVTVSPLHPIVLKLGGELLEEPARLQALSAAIAAIVGVKSASPAPLIIVHGGGKEIDSALAAAGIEKRQVDGLRITDEATLHVVVSVLAGAVNTRLVAALVAAGVPAVGLTGADAGCGLVEAAPPHRAVDGRVVDLGRVGIPSERSNVGVLTTLLEGGFVPVVACIGANEAGQLFNVNADTLAGHLAARAKARRLVVAGTTAGVLDAKGSTVPLLGADAVAQMIDAATATAGMIAKLRACERALAGGVDEVVIVDGRDGAALEMVATTNRMPPNATGLIRPAATARV
ncbi:MAG TPA: acetylglutamate kinase [Vicinamibacterales bacterium]|jgi:acetylglutamate kinase